MFYFNNPQSGFLNINFERLTIVVYDDKCKSGEAIIRILGLEDAGCEKKSQTLRGIRLNQKIRLLSF